MCEHKNICVDFKMKPVLIAVFFINLSTSIQEERQGRLHPAYIYNGGVTKVKESENIIFKCSTFNMTVNRTESIISMYLFKNNERVKMKAIEDTKIDDTTFLLTNLTVEHSGLYTCLYSEENLNVLKTNATGHNSVSLEVWGKILPARIESTETSVTKGETLKLTCTFTKILNCAQVYVYLCVNGIGNSKKQVNCSNRNISTTFHLIVSENSVNYSCVYSVSNYNVSEVRNTGENSIFVHGGDFSHIMPANIILRKVGQNLDLKCSIPGLKAEFKQIHMYLCKNGDGLRMKLLRDKNEHIFILNKVSEEDSGIYSCVYSLQKHNQDLCNTTHNQIQVHIYGLVWERNLLRLIFSVGVLMLVCFIIIFDFKTRNSSEEPELQT
ncbi:basement membrane-specific heparan sulfate proteoglycan core protein-like [Tachysurus fulvidraco]|uniref:basement membrane-specific heparan sulfate proteoglycan core protein-like n=1 Tax=Tachysurus fulvidraco TaxID=1234273 RepID=UPI001FF03399|nr:basement membrane-specific heparan sulfate proteoglycan core protein-like [Tachysurus fulvidraco]